jgi:hypothetical protein
MSIESRLAALEDDAGEAFEDRQAMTHEMMRLQLLIDTLADMVSPGFAEAIKNEVDFIAQAKFEIDKIQRGDS